MRSLMKSLIVNGGQKRVATLTPTGGSTRSRNSASVVSFQPKGQRPVVITEQDDEYCIWSGKIKIQRRNPGNESERRLSFAVIRKSQ